MNNKFKILLVIIMIINERKKYMDVFNHVDHQLLLIHKDVNVSIVVLLCVP